MKRTVACSIAMSLMLLAVVPSAMAAAPGGRIAFTSQPSATTEALYTVNPNGTGLKKVLTASWIDRLAFSHNASRSLGFGYHTTNGKNYIAVANSAGRITRKVGIADSPGQVTWYGGTIVFGVYFGGLYSWNPTTSTVSPIVSTNGLTYDHAPVVVGSSLFFVHGEWDKNCYGLELPHWTHYIGSPVTGPNWVSIPISNAPPPAPLRRIAAINDAGDEDIHMQYSSKTGVMVYSSAGSHGTIRYVVKESRHALKLPSHTARVTYAYLSNSGRKIAFGTEDGVFVTNLVGKLKMTRVSRTNTVDYGQDQIAWSPHDDYLAIGTTRDVRIVAALSKRWERRIVALHNAPYRSVGRIAWSDR